jgi:hypothetical protein
MTWQMVLARNNTNDRISEWNNPHAHHYRAARAEVLAARRARRIERRAALAHVLQVRKRWMTERPGSDAA